MLETLGAEETDVAWCDFRTYWIRSQTRPAIQVRPNADHSAGWLGRGARVCIGWEWRYRRGFGWDAECGMEAQRGCDGAGRTPYELLLLCNSHAHERSQTHSVRMCCRPGRRRPALSGRSCQAKRGGAVIGQTNEVTIERKTSARSNAKASQTRLMGVAIADTAPSAGLYEALHMRAPALEPVKLAVDARKLAA